MALPKLAIAFALSGGMAFSQPYDALAQEGNSAGSVLSESQTGSPTYLQEIVARALALLERPVRNPARAARLLKEAADAGDSTAMVALAQLYLSGDGVDVDAKRARELLKDAAGTGQTLEGWIALADFYNADGSNADRSREKEALERAAEMGDQRSMVRLVQMLDRRDDFGRTESLLSRAGAISGDASAEAWRRLGDLYYNADVRHRDRAKAADAYRKALLYNDIPAMIRLARMLGSGDGITADFDAAKDLLDRVVAISQDDGDRLRAIVMLGDLYRDADEGQRDLAKAADAYERAANLGDVEATFILARMLSNGDGRPTDIERAASMLRGVAESGGDIAKDAWFALGELYRGADTPNNDITKAAEAYQAAADLGHSRAMYRLGRIVMQGEGVPYNFERARDLLQAAAAIGDSTARWAWEDLGDLYQRAERPWRDSAKAAQAYSRAANLGDVGAMFDLARMLSRGDGIPANFERARDLIVEAIETPGDHTGRAWSALGDLYREANSANRDLDKAIHAYEKAADLGDQSARIELAELILSGANTPPDYNRVISLLKAAADGGNASAWEVLGDLYRREDTPLTNITKALAYYELAAAEGSGPSHLAAAEIKSGSAQSPEERAVLLLHYRAAVEDVGSRPVARSMLALRPVLLVAVVQQLLNDSGYGAGSVDGVYGARSRRAAAAFCQDNNIDTCDDEIVTLGLLRGLLEARD